MQFLDFAMASLDETENHLREGVECRYFPAEVIGPIILLLARCRKAMSSWHSYLRSVASDPRYNQSRRKR